MHRKHGGFGGFWKSQLVELRTRLWIGRVNFRGLLRPDEFARYRRRTRWGGGRWKSQNSVAFSYTCSCRIHTDAMKNRCRKTSLTKYLYLSLYCKGSKGLFKFWMWEGAGDRTELKYFDPHSYGRQRCVFLVLLMLNRRPWGPLCWVLAFFTASYQQLLWSPNSIRVPEGPLGRVWLSLPQLVYNSVSNCLDFCLDWAI